MPTRRRHNKRIRSATRRTRNTKVTDTLRQDFYNSLLSQPASNPATDFKRIADAWRSATNADWVWLWLKNPHLHSSAWEIQEVACDDNHRERFLPKDLGAPAQFTVSEYISRTGLPEFVEDIHGWRQQLDGHIFTVACAEGLVTAGCDTFLSIPFMSQRPTNATATPGHLVSSPISGCVCCHFFSQTKPVRHPNESLALMARLTALTVVNSYQATQRDILMELNTLAEHYLTIVSKRPTRVRRNYLNHVIHLISTRLHVGAVSIFYQEDHNEPEVVCIASTGIADANGKRIPENRLSDIAYRAGEGLTGKCFAESAPAVLSSAETASRSPKFVETLGNDIVGQHEAVLYPIPRPASQIPGDPHTAQDKKPIEAKYAHGVIRCADHRAHLLQGQPRPFDPIDLQTLDFIARQIGPVLETLTVRIQREETISIVKHDLYAPLTMIRHTADELTTNSPLGPSTDTSSTEASNTTPNSTVGRIRYLELINLKTAALVAGNLIGQLDPDPAEIGAFRPEPTYLEKDIVRRIEHMLAHYARIENKMTMRFTGFRSVHEIWIDRTLIERVFVNLLMNAVKYGEYSSTVTVKAFDTDTHYQVDVCNEGSGITKEESERIFEKGFRGNGRKRERFGLGLGLYIARAAMRKHGGDLSLTQLQSPTIFSLLFPHTLRQRRPKGDR